MLRFDQEIDMVEYRFKEGVIITIPEQATPVSVRRHIQFNSGKYPPPGLPNEPARIVFAFEFVDDQGNPLPLNDFTFNLPIELAVRYTHYDLERSMERKVKPELWYFNGVGWKQLTEAQHKFRLIPDRLNLKNINDETGGYGVAYFTDSNDPAVGWNP